MIAGQRFDPDKATELDRVIFRVSSAVIGAGIAVFSVLLLARGLMGDLEKLAIAGVGFLGLGASVWVWRRIDRRMTRAIEARRAERPADSGEEMAERSARQLHSLKIADREVFIDATPLKTLAPGFRTETLQRAGRRILVQKPPLWIWFFALACILAGVTLVYVLSTDRGRTGREEPLGPSWGALFASPFLVVGLVAFVLPCRLEFDPDAGCMRTCRLGHRRVRPMRKVLAIQLIEFAPSEYQLNLVLDDEQRSRLCLTSHKDGATIRAKGVELAKFLGVALLDEVSGEKREVV